MRFLERAVESRGGQDTGWTLAIADGRTHPPVKKYITFYILTNITHLSHFMITLSCDNRIIIRRNDSNE